MKQRVGLAGVAVVGVICFVLGIVAQRVYESRRPPARPPVQAGAQPEAEPHAPESAGVNVASINFEHEPLWAYGFLEPPKPGEKAQPQAPPTQEPAAQPGSGRADQAAPRERQQRDVFAGRRARWPERHRLVPRRSPADAQCRRARSGEARQEHPRLRLVPPAERQGTAGKCAAVGAARRVLRPPDPGLPQRRAAHGRSPQAEHEHDDRSGEGHDGRRNQGRGRVLLGDQVDAVDSRGRNEDGAQDPHRRQPVPAG